MYAYAYNSWTGPVQQFLLVALPLEVSTAALQVSAAPLEVSTAPLEVSTAALEVSTAPLEVSTALLEVSTAALELRAAPLEVGTAVLARPRPAPNTLEHFDRPGPAVLACIQYASPSK